MQRARDALSSACEFGTRLDLTVALYAMLVALQLVMVFISLARVTLIVGDVANFNFAHNGTLVLFPLRLIIFLTFILFTLRIYDAFMRGSRFRIVIEFAMGVLISLCINAYYNKIYRQCYLNAQEQCTEDPAHRFYNSWILLMLPYNIFHLIHIFAFFLQLAADRTKVSLFYKKNHVEVLDSLLRLIDVIYWPLYLDGSSLVSFTYPFMAVLPRYIYYGILYWRTKRNFEESPVNLIILILYTWPQLVVSVFPKFMWCITVIPYLATFGYIILSSMLYGVQEVEERFHQHGFIFSGNDQEAEQYVEENVHDDEEEYDEQKSTKYCAKCGISGARKKCSRCLKGKRLHLLFSLTFSVYYCNRECQKKDWKRHKLECNN